MSWNPAVLQSATSFWPSDVDTATIYRYGDGVAPTKTLIWSGAADLQEGAGDIYYNPQGAVEEIDARMFIDASPLPAIDPDDRVTYGGDSKTFAVVAVLYKPFVFPYLEVLLKRGPLHVEQK